MQTRLSVQKDFAGSLKVTPRIIHIKGNPEWVDNYLAFGDLIEVEMGSEARDFYYETLYSLLRDIGDFESLCSNCLCTDCEGSDIEATPEPKPKEPEKTTKKAKKEPVRKRALF